MVSSFVRARRAGGWAAAIVALCFCAWGTVASAETINGPVYPPPGGVSLSATGNLIATGGVVFTYQNFNPSAYGDLWWAPSSSNGIAFDGSINTPNETLTLLSLTGNTATFVGTSAMNTAFGVRSVDTRLTLVATDLSGNAINWDLGATEGVPSSIALDVPGDYRLTLAATARLTGTTTYQSAQSLYDSSNTVGGQQLVTSIGGGFYFTAPAAEGAPVPLPLAAVGGFALMGGMSLRRIRRQGATAA